MNQTISRKNRMIAFFLVLFCFLGMSTPLTSYAKKKQPKLNVTKVSMLQNKTYTIQVYRLKKNQTVSFSIQDESIAYITKTTKKSCTFKSESVGKTKLIATVYEKEKKVKTLSCSIHVTPPAVSVRFKKRNCYLSTGETLGLRSLITLKPSFTAEVPVFPVRDHSWLRVTPNGFATALSTGTVTVTATIANGKSDQISIHIKEDDKDS